MPELVKVASSAGRSFGWTSNYVDVLITAAGAVFKAVRLDEASDAIDVSTVAVGEQIERLVSERTAQGASPRTIASYTTAWKRLAAVTRAWAEGGKSDSVADWDALAVRMADTRVRRKRSSHAQPTDPSGIQPSTMTELTVDLLDGRTATLALPEHLHEREVLAIIAVVTQHGLRRGKIRRSAGMTAVTEDET
jgi:hypothetical protein